jgi:hypothetical protein
VPQSKRHSIPNFGTKIDIFIEFLKKFFRKIEKKRRRG